MKYELQGGELNSNQISEVSKLQNTLYDLKEEFERISNELETTKFVLQQKMEEYHINKVENEYFTITYVPATEPSVKMIPNEKALDELFDEIGVAKGDYYTEKKVSGRKAYIRWGNK